MTLSNLQKISHWFSIIRFLHVKWCVSIILYSQLQAPHGSISFYLKSVLIVIMNGYLPYSNIKKLASMQILRTYVAIQFFLKWWVHIQYIVYLRIFLNHLKTRENYLWLLQSNLVLSRYKRIFLLEVYKIDILIACANKNTLYSN